MTIKDGQIRKNQPIENDKLMGAIQKAFILTEKSFENYIMMDRMEYLKSMSSTYDNNGMLKLLSDKITFLKSKVNHINEIRDCIKNKNIYTICKLHLCGKEAEDPNDWDKCNDFIVTFLKIIQVVTDILMVETAQYYINMERNASEQPQKKIDYIKQVIEVFETSLKLLNKNSSHDVKDFFELREHNEQYFLMISRIRIFGYVIRAFSKYILLKKNPKYSIGIDDYDYVLNDCNKVLNILERDFHLSAIQYEKDKSKLKKYFEKQELKIICFSYVVVNIIKGQIYYEMRNNSRALDSFLNAVRFFNKIKESINPKKIPVDIAVSKLMIGKIFSDKGLFIDALDWYLESLYDFLDVFCKINEIEELRAAMKAVICSGVLSVEKHNDIINKEIIHTILRDIDICKLKILAKKPDAMNWAKGYISDVLSRVGYIFYILLGTSCTDVQVKIRSWYQVALDLSTKNSLAIQNLSLLPGTLDHAILTSALSSNRAEPSRKLNLLSLSDLNFKTDLYPNNKCLERNILRSMLTNLENIITTPQKFNKQIIIDRKVGKAQHKDINKLLCLRRWNSFTPTIPRPIDFNRGAGGAHSYTSNKCPGGGYFLIWNNKGIVIDPGFDFIRNLYSSGYSISDVDAIILTHSHIDHMGDFFTLLTLIYERKSLIELLHGENAEEFSKIDILLNIGCMNSFLPWFAPQTKDTIRNIHSLPRASTKKDPKNFILDLINTEYNMKIEVTKAFHNELSNKDWAIGLKFHLPVKVGKDYIILGITSDTAYSKDIIEQYKDCDLIAGHLGDINFKELVSFANINFDKDLGKNIAYGIEQGADISNLKELAISLGVTESKLSALQNPRNIVELILKREDKYRLNNHLGFKGIYKLAKQLFINDRCYQKLFILTEFPEYFGSFRKRIAGHFNQQLCKEKRTFFTGDTGLQIKIDHTAENPGDIFRIQCNKCARDNDVSINDSFHIPDNCQETCVKAADELIVYFCKMHRVEPTRNFINKITQ